ncbi:MAG: hypothetical protein ABW110_19000 [Steroidobacteraceae bacterium]
MSYIQQDLDLAQRHVDEGVRRVDHQRALIELLHKAGYDVSAAEETLRILETAQREFVAHRDRIAMTLGQPKYPRSPSSS